MNINKKQLFIIFSIWIVCYYSYYFNLDKQRLLYFPPKYIIPENYRCVVIISLDDVAYNRTKYNECFEMLIEKKLYHTMGLITDKANWNYIRYWLNFGYSEIASHSRTHPYIPYNDYDSEIGKSKDDIIGNLSIYDVNTYILPYGQWDNKLIKTLRKYNYIVFRDIRKDKGGYSKDLFRAILTIEMGNNWGTNDTEKLNNLFDEIYNETGIYHLMMHPTHVNWKKGEYADIHLSYISNRKDVWYITLGGFYFYQKYPHLIDLNKSMDELI